MLLAYFINNQSVKIAINPMHFIAIQNTYEAIELAVCHQTTIIDRTHIAKEQASKLIIIELEQLLRRNNLQLSDCSFIAANQGPGPFTTLRVVITTVNALSFATKIPLIGINGLEAILKEHASSDYPFSIALLNAFNHDVYFGIAQAGIMVQDGYDNGQHFLQELRQNFPDTPLHFIGNAIPLYQKEIQTLFGNLALFKEPIPQTCSLAQIATLGWHAWQERQHICFQLMPLYLKPFSAVMR